MPKAKKTKKASPTGTFFKPRLLIYMVAFAAVGAYWLWQALAANVQSPPPPPGSSKISAPKTTSAGNTALNNFISNVAVSNISATSVAITWTTQKSSTSKITYGLDPNKLDSTVSWGQSVTQHDLTLNDLAPNQTYYFAITATDGTQEYTKTGQFSTQGSGGGQTTPSNHPSSTSVAKFVIGAVLVGTLGLWLLARRRQISRPLTVGSEKSDLPEPKHLAHQKKEVYTPHSLIPKETVLDDSRKGSIAADSVEMPEDMFEAGRERLEREGLSKEDHPKKHK